jgi:uncharacterized protein YdeI (YjbR/CyaY-like superfamily)
MEEELETVCPQSREEWRAWLQEHHATKRSVWLIYYKRGAQRPSLPYTEAVDEALCFGWIDSKAKPLDAERYMQFFSKRKATSVWSRVNKEKVARLIDEGRMTEAGHASIATARQNGSWTILDEAEALTVPEDLDRAFAARPEARAYFMGLSRSVKRNMLQWLVLAKRAETRQKRIDEIVTLAAQGQKPKQFR